MVWINSLFIRSAQFLYNSLDTEYHVILWKPLEHSTLDGLVILPLSIARHFKILKFVHGLVHRVALFITTEDSARWYFWSQLSLGSCLLPSWSFYYAHLLLVWHITVEPLFSGEEGGKAGLYPSQLNVRLAAKAHVSLFIAAHFCDPFS